ncbi:MAG: hypothetical protein C3F13_10645 [Anaerolineales bacterium]|nr:MAG: hypothetical protein C3F13_10645 [Anaerolineales bacterium]
MIILAINCTFKRLPWGILIGIIKDEYKVRTLTKNNMPDKLQKVHVAHVFFLEFIRSRSEQ